MRVAIERMNTDSEGCAGEHSEFHRKGMAFLVPARRVHGRDVISIGRWPRIATINDEEWLDGYPVLERPSEFISSLKASGLPADIFAFWGRIDDPSEDLGFPFEIDNVAAIRTDDFKSWWDGLPQEARKNTRRAVKRGVDVRPAEYDERMVAGIKAIYDETPIRQGRRFWHYGKDIDVVRRENGTYLDRSEFLGAYLGDQLIGFIKYVFVNDAARIMQILSFNAHQDKRPMIALIAKAAERCHERGVRYLIYGKLNYGRKKGSSIAEFKKRLGFEQIPLRRYYVPLTYSGRVAMSLGAHKDWHERLPTPAINFLLSLRKWWLNGFSSRATPPAKSQ